VPGSPPRTGPAPTAPARPARYPLLLPDDWGPDPLAGLPAEVLDRLGALDVDTAGGCG